MVYKFRIISDEVDDFLREIDIDSEASFYDLHEAILKSTSSVMTIGKKKRKSHWKIWVTEVPKKILT